MNGPELNSGSDVQQSGLVLHGHRLLPQALDELAARGLEVSKNSSQENLVKVIQEAAATQPKSRLPADSNPIPLMQEFVSKYSTGLPPKSSGSKKPLASSKKNVLVTGTTGSLGFYLVVSALKDANVGTIYCLNRSGEAEKNFWSRYTERDDQVPVSQGKLRFIKVSFGEELFGLDRMAFRQLSEDVDVIIHNAWMVNFNAPLAAFEPHIRGLHTMISISLSSPRQPALYFVSSIGACGKPNGASLPESIFHDPNCQVGQTGYNQAKWVSEHVLDAVSRTYGVTLNILRIGQIAGPIHDELSAWSPKEWVPRLIKSSKAMRLLPEAIGFRDLDWIPLDTIADIMIEMALLPNSNNDNRPGAAIFNLVNPSRVRFQTIVSEIQAHFNNGTRIVSFNEWVDELAKLDRNAPGAIQRYPSLELLDYLMQMRNNKNPQKYIFETKRAEARSRKMRELGGITGGMARTWLRQWKL